MVVWLGVFRLRARYFCRQTKVPKNWLRNLRFLRTSLGSGLIPAFLPIRRSVAEHTDLPRAVAPWWGSIAFSPDRHRRTWVVGWGLRADEDIGPYDFGSLCVARDDPARSLSAFPWGKVATPSGGDG